MSQVTLVVRAENSAALQTVSGEIADLVTRLKGVEGAHIDLEINEEDGLSTLGEHIMARLPGSARSAAL